MPPVTLSVLVQSVKPFFLTAIWWLTGLMGYRHRLSGIDAEVVDDNRGTGRSARPLRGHDECVFAGPQILFRCHFVHSRLDSLRAEQVLFLFIGSHVLARKSHLGNLCFAPIFLLFESKQRELIWTGDHVCSAETAQAAHLREVHVKTPGAHPASA